MNYIYDPCELYHHGVLGMKWHHHKASIANMSTARNKVSLLTSKNASLQKKVDKLNNKTNKILEKETGRKIKYATEIGYARYKKNSKKVMDNNRKVAKLSKKIEQNKTIKASYQKRISELSSETANKGKQYINTRR